jgi:hypothetical protein
VFIGLALDSEHFVEDLRLAPRAVDAILIGRGGIEGFDVEILYVGAIVREAPGNSVVVANDDERSAGQSEAFNVPTGRGEVNFVPDGRNGQLEMCVIGEQWLAACGVRTADDPIVAAEAVADLAA